MCYLPSFGVFGEKLALLKLLYEHFLTCCGDHYFSWFLKNTYYLCYLQTYHIGCVCPLHLSQVNSMIKEVTEVSIVEEEGQKAHHQSHSGHLVQ